MRLHGTDAQRSWTQTLHKLLYTNGGRRCLAPGPAGDVVLTFLTLAEKSVMILRMLLVSAKSLQMKGSSAQITLMDKPGPEGQIRSHVSPRNPRG